MIYLHAAHLEDRNNWHRRYYIGSTIHPDGTRTDAFIFSRLHDLVSKARKARKDQPSQ